MSWLDIRDDLTYFEYICLLMEASDGEELDDFRYTSLTAVAFHAPKRLKKWKFSSLDKAGTKKVGKPGEAIAKFALEKLGPIQIPTSDRAERAMRYARDTNRPFAYQLEGGKLVDVDGNSVERAPMMVIVPYHKEKLI